MAGGELSSPHPGVSPDARRGIRPGLSGEIMYTPLIVERGTISGTSRKNPNVLETRGWVLLLTRSISLQSGSHPSLWTGLPLGASMGLRLRSLPLPFRSRQAGLSATEDAKEFGAQPRWLPRSPKTGCR